MEFVLIVGLGATVMPALLVFVLNLFCPGASPTRLAWLAASVAPVLIGVFILLFIAAGFAEPAPLRPLPLTEVVTGLAIDAAAVVGTLVVGYLIARLVLTSLRGR